MIELMWPRTLDQPTGTETWVLHAEPDRAGRALVSYKGGWNLFLGPRLVIPATVCDGKLEDICQELQGLRDSCPKKAHTPGWNIGWQPRQLVDQKPVILRREDGTVRFALLWVVTTGKRVLGEEYRETGPEEEPLVSFAQAVKEWADESYDTEPFREVLGSPTSFYMKVDGIMRLLNGKNVAHIMGEALPHIDAVFYNEFIPFARQAYGGPPGNRLVVAGPPLPEESIEALRSWLAKEKG